jgi:hypothetical protein
MTRPVDPVFVVGVPRSGTTLLSAMLSAHPRIAISPETHFMRWAERHRDLDLSRDEDLETFWSDYRAGEPFSRLGIDGEEARARIDALIPRGYREVFLTLVELATERTGKPRRGEKTPAHEEWVTTLLDWFPESRVIHVLRDPRAVLASLRRVSWARQPLAFYAWRWAGAVDRLHALSGEPRVRAVRYEDLVTEPARVLREICEFLGEGHDEAMVSAFADAGAELSRDEPWKDNVRGPVRTDRVESWRDELTERQVALIEAIAREGMDRHGYARASGPHPLVAARVAAQRLVRRIRGR